MDPAPAPGRLVAALMTAALLAPARAPAYPLDAADETGIQRLEAYRLAQDYLLERQILQPGALRPAAEIELALRDRPGFKLPEPDPEFTAEVRSLLGEDAGSYGLAVLDLTDPDAPRYAAYNAERPQNPGSVGKVIVVLAWMQALADRFPDDVAARKRLLRDTRVTANRFIVHDSHVVPFWEPGADRVEKRPIEQGDTANLWTYLDWMCSSSSNAAAAMLMAELVLFRHFGERYPVTDAEARRYFDETPREELRSTFLAAIRDPIDRNGLDSDKLRQGSFFTRRGKQIVPGTNSVATPRELLRFAVQMEKGALVDAWSSLEIKRLLYLTEKRIRYASSPALADSAVYYKSGSLYSCKPEEGFVCKKYHGNRLNYMNSIAVVETPAHEPPLHYVSVVLSNVLRKNSAVEHQTLGTRLHRLIERTRSTAAR